ncbi:MAG: TonB family protein [Mariprofundaceae bacterium]|nr:TonB family protein [Mariprofundaceae bacterium]
MKENKTLAITIVVSILLHLLFMQLFSYEQEKQQQKVEKKPEKTIMDVALLAPEVPKKKEEPKKAAAIADKNQKVEKEPEKKVLRPKKEPQKKPVEAVKKERKKVQSPKPKQPDKVEEQVNQVVKKEAEKKLYKPLSEINLDPSSDSINKIAQQKPQQHRLKSMLSSEANIPINTREEKYAAYAHALVVALEEQWQPGKDDYQAYPEMDRRVLLRITINRKGQLERVVILRASPLEHLNKSALKALRDAAPYRPLPLSWGFDRVSFRLSFEVIDDRATFRTL